APDGLACPGSHDAVGRTGIAAILRERFLELDHLIGGQPHVARAMPPTGPGQTAFAALDLQRVACRVARRRAPRRRVLWSRGRLLGEHKRWYKQHRPETGEMTS